MSIDLKDTILKDFLQNSWTSVEKTVKELARFKEASKTKTRVFHFRNAQGNESTLNSSHFFLRASVEYSNPQVTLEELQGIIAARLLETCGNHFYNSGLHPVEKKDIDQISEKLTKPSSDMIVSFLLNTDDVEPDRYSNNPLRESILTSGQSAFPSATVKTNELGIDENFVSKYEGTLISREEIEILARRLEGSNKSYVDMVDSVKYEQLTELSKSFGINLCINSMRMPLAILDNETKTGLLHHIIQEVHNDYDSVERAYRCMGRSMQKRTTLLTVPHSKKGYGSKRAARGKIYFEGKKLREIHVDYRRTPLYDNEIDPKDITVAEAEDSFIVEGDRLSNYNFRETPSSPQFFLYALASPENAAIWHGIGVFAPQLLKSIVAMRSACAEGSVIKNLTEEYGVCASVPLNLSLVARHMWAHPDRRNVDASVGCVKDLNALAKMGMRLEAL